jgi:hypothetical protein
MSGPLFEAKKRLYPQKVKGRFRRLKWILNSVFLSIYFYPKNFSNHPQWPTPF